MKFVSLHHHSTFSYLDGYGQPERHVERAVALGMPAMALTEHGNVTSHVRLEQSAEKAGIKPIFGVELYTGAVSEEKRTQRKNHLTILAEDQNGYQNLLRLVSRGWAEGFYYEPTVSGEMLREHAEGLVVLSGCSGSLVATSLVGGKNVDPRDASLDRAKAASQQMSRTLGDHFYLEVQAFPELEKVCTINRGLARIAGELKIPLVATLDCHYTQPDEAEMQMILHQTRGMNKQSSEDRARDWGYQAKLTMFSDREVYDKLRATGLSHLQAQEAVLNTLEIAERCNVTIPKVENLRYPLPDDITEPEVLFRRWLNDGWNYRGFTTLPPQERGRYIERVKYEAGLIELKGFVDYFLVIADAVKFAKDSGIPVGPARGSAAASLVCYLLRITEVNPMLFPTLLFERFIDLNRHDLPDIDLDFDDELRHIVKRYLEDKYGAEKVGNIATFVRYKGKNSLDDVARVFHVPVGDIETVKGMLIERSSGDLRANATIEDSIEMFPQVKEVFDRNPKLYKALELEGNVKGMSVHAAGLVIANSPLSDFCAVYTREGSDGEIMQVVSLDKYDAEYLNVLKFDALGLKTMAAIRIALQNIGISLEELYAVPLDDPSTLRGFQEGDVIGIFQFDGRAMRSVNSGVVPDNFSEVADINALARPGPLHSGATGEYIDIKHGRKNAVHYHSIVDDITKHTQFQVVYQEQILQTVRLLGNFSWEEAARIRKIISKKRGEQEFNQQRDKFVQGAETHGMDASDAHRVFNMLATAGAYAFNAAHCVSYGLLAYWCMWLKRHYPTAFYAGMLAKFYDSKKHEKQAQLLRDLTAKNITIFPLKVNHSADNWEAVGKEGVRPGFVQVPGIGKKTAESLVKARANLGGRFDSEKELRTVPGIGKVTVKTIVDFAQAEDPFGLTKLYHRLQKVRDALAMGMEDSDSGGLAMLPAPTHTASEVPYERTPADVGVVWCGIVRERNLKDLFELHHSRTGEILDPAKVQNPERNEWVVMNCEDETDLIVVTIDRWKYRRFRNAIWSIEPDKDVILVRGVKKKIQTRRAIYVTDMWVLSEEE